MLESFVKFCITEKITALAVERAMVEGALRASNGSISEAGRLIGMTRDQIRYRIEKMQMHAFLKEVKKNKEV